MYFGNDREDIINLVSTISNATKQLSAICSKYPEEFIDSIISTNYPFIYSLEEMELEIENWENNVKMEA